MASNPVKSEDLDNAEAIFSATAVYTNKTYVTASPMGFRLTFVEGYGEGAEKVRAAVYMSILDVLSLRDVLDSQLKNYDVSIEAAKNTKLPVTT